jgi:hypothetical protein
MQHPGLEFLGELTSKFLARLIGDDVLGIATDKIIEDWHLGREVRFRTCHASPKLTIWVLLLMALYRDLGVYSVYQKLLSFLGAAKPGTALKPLTAEAIVKARMRLGSQPLQELFREQAGALSIPSSFKGYRLWALDASEFTLPDTPENVREFGRRADACYPSAKAVVLLDIYGRRVRDCAWTGWSTHEINCASAVTSTLSSKDLLLLDSGYASFRFFWELVEERGASFVCRVTSQWNPEIVEELSRGDTLVKVRTNKRDRAEFYRQGIDPNREMLCRLITFRVGSGEVIRLLTNLTDAKQHRKTTLAKLYHRRWEIEVSFDEIKNELFSVRRGKQPSHFRSKTPSGIYQEAWALLVCYNLVRDLMVEAAELAEAKPRDISFTRATSLINGFVHFCACFKTEKKVLPLRDALIERIGQSVIDRPQRPRSCCRKVKKKMTRFRRKRPGDPTEEGKLSIRIRFIKVVLGKKLKEVTRY